MPLFVTIVLDGVGIGAQSDAAAFGDEGCDTLGHVCEHRRLTVPNLERNGLGCIKPLSGLRCASRPEADFGVMREVSAGKDSTTGHWELAGIELERPFPTYSRGFPETLINEFLARTGEKGILGNEVASGTEIISRLGDRHCDTGHVIVYTSADSVFQVAAHVDVVPLQRLYEMCHVAREEILIGDHSVGRVIARPFRGGSGEYVRISPERRDFSLRPPRPPIQSRLQDAGVRTVAIGKIGDLFAGVGFDEIIKTKSNPEGLDRTLETIRSSTQMPTFVWTNLVDFDQEFGHRNNVEGFAGALEEFDARLPELEAELTGSSVLVLTADHGNDPTFPGTDHTREYVPLLVRRRGSGRSLGSRSTFADHAATVADYFKVPFESGGTSFLGE